MWKMLKKKNRAGERAAFAHLFWEDGPGERLELPHFPAGPGPGVGVDIFLRNIYLKKHIFVMNKYIL